MSNGIFAHFQVDAALPLDNTAETPRSSIAGHQETAVLFPNFMCRLTAIVGWPLMPDWMKSILLPDFKNSRVCSSIDCEVSTAAGCFLLAGALVGVRAIVF
jgi:hypothetical protein